MARYSAIKSRDVDLNLKLAFFVIAILVAAIAWTFAAPYVAHWRSRRAAARRRQMEGRRP